MFATLTAHRPAPAASNAHRILGRIASRTVWGAAWLLAAAFPGLAQSGPGPTVAPASQPAAGRHVAKLTVPAFGRYSLAVKSQQGASLELVDRMAGALGTDGDAVTAAGRLRSLPRSRRVPGHHPGQRTRQRVRRRSRSPLRWSCPPRPARCSEERKEIAAILDDHQRASWWVRIEVPRRLLREPRDGASPICIGAKGPGSRAPCRAAPAGSRSSGQPMVDCQLATTSAKGSIA